MAITLSIEITTAEQNRIQALADLIKPGLTPAQLKAWAEKEAKDCLRQKLLMMYQQYYDEQWNNDVTSAMNLFQENWPELTPELDPVVFIPVGTVSTTTSGTAMLETP